MLPRLKSLNCLAGDGTLLISLDPRTRVELADPSGQVLALLELLRDGTRTPAELRAALVDRWPDVTQSDVDDALESLDGFGWLEDADAPQLLTAYQRERYFSNLAFFDAFTTLETHRESFQERMLGAHVLLLGAGGLGSSVVQNLAGLGVGRITLVDFDRVELKNLARQFTYTEAHVGLSKVEQVAAWLQSFNSQVQVQAHNLRISCEADILPLLTDEVDLVVHAIDQPDDIDLIVNAACMRRGVPFIRGGLAYTQGLYWSVDPGRSACRQCLENHRVEQARGEDVVLFSWPAVMRAERPNRATGPVAQMLGALMAMEALRYLTGLVPPVSGGTYHLVDFAADCLITTDAWHMDPACALCDAARARLGSAPAA
jgi:molybdopterin-synthase adenylyltransferase